MYFSHFRTCRDLIVTAAIFTFILAAPRTLLADITNTATGSNALRSGTGNFNSAFGYYSLYYNVSGALNTAIGGQALFSNSTGYQNTATGVNALYANGEGYQNTAVGVSALYNNTYGAVNTATGGYALYNNTSGYANTAMGMRALYRNTTGVDNTAVGESALYSNSGNYNTATGESALASNTTGTSNTANGMNAMLDNGTGTNNTAIGSYALARNSTGNNNIAVGFFSGGVLTTGSYNIEIGNSGSSADNGVIRIGNAGNQTQTYIAGISGVVPSGGVQVYINSAGQLGTMNSSQRFKKDIKSIDNISDKLMQLRPVSFIYKEDENNEVQYGLIAEEVAKVYPELVQFDKDGKPFTVYYHLLTPLMLSELQKEHALVTSQREKIDVQQNELANLNQQLTAEHAEMRAMLRQQKAQVTALQEKLIQLDNLLEANSSKEDSSKVAMAANR